ncbi:hypothetical protein F5Y02DRAFT_425350 [Annulohypoxylon stygium]|nr:hypothetical protein F5Y02DRAFT_425350 [Annulohypoxylon stygium]
MINLSGLQAKLQDLQNEYKEIQAEDADSGDSDRVNLVNDFYLMRDLAEEENGESGQYDILMAIRDCLKEYILTISQAQKPKNRDVKEFRKWLIRPSMGSNFLVGIEADVWKDEYAQDFISPTSEEIDSFDSFLTGPILDACHWLYGHEKKGQNLKSQDFWIRPEII